MRVAELWRYPVKSMQGERLAAVDVEPDGLHGDRAWAVRDDATGKILTGRRDPQLLTAGATLVEDLPRITLPDGQVLLGEGPEVDVALSEWLGRPVRLVPRGHDERSEIELFEDAVDETSPVLTWRLPAVRFVDVMPILLVTTASLRAGAALHPEGQWEARRFRPNVLVEADGDGWLEDLWQGVPVQVGPVGLVGDAPCARCTMIIREQPGGIVRDADVFKVLARAHGATFGLWATVAVPGPLAVGDAVSAPV